MMLLFQNHVTKTILSQSVPKTSSLKIFTPCSPLVCPLDQFHQVTIINAWETLLSETLKWTTQLKVSISSQIQEMGEMELSKIFYMKTFIWILQFGGQFGSDLNNNINQVVLFKAALWSIHSVASVKLSQELLWETLPSETLHLLALFFQLVVFSVTQPTHVLTSLSRTSTWDPIYGINSELASLLTSLRVFPSTLSQIQNSSHTDTTATQLIEFLTQNKIQLSGSQEISYSLKWRRSYLESMLTSMMSRTQLLKHKQLLNLSNENKKIIRT